MMTEEKTKKSKSEARGDESGDLPVKSLITAFKDDNPGIRGEAAEMLVKIGKPAVVSLIAALAVDVPFIRGYAARVLGSIADHRAVLPLTGLLKDPAPGVREEAARALGETGYRDVIKPLVTALEDTNAAVRKKAAEALDRIDWAPADKNELSLYAVAKQKWDILPFIGQVAIAPLIRVIKAEEQPVRDGAADTLGSLGDSASLIPVVETLDFDDAAFRQKAANALDKIGWKPAGKEEAARYYFARQDWAALRSLGKHAMETLTIALKDKNPATRVKAVKTLGEIGDAQAITSLLDLMKDGEAAVRNETVLALGKMVDPDTVKHLLSALKDSRYDKEKVIEALGEKADPAAVEYLTNVLKDKSWEARRYREAAARALGNIKDARAVGPLTEALKSKFYEVRKEAAEALGKIGDEKALLPLIAVLNDEDGNFREIVIDSLCKIPKPGKVEPLVDTLKDQDALVRQGAAVVLSRIGWTPTGNREIALYLTAKQEWDKLPDTAEYAIEPLIAVLKDGDPEVRKNAVLTLGRIGDPEAAEPLIEALKNHHLHDTYMRDLIEAVGEIGDARALGNLTYFLNTFLEEDAKKALAKIRSKLSSRDLDFFCKKCFRRVKRSRVRYPVFENNVFSHKSISYYACSNCHSNSYLLEKIEKVVLLLDRDFVEPYVQEKSVMIVNWLKKKEPSDFDEIRIKNAGDFEVGELVKKLKNDRDDKREKGLPAVPVYLSPGLNLSAAKMNLLKDNFQVKINNI